jgi:hypothetical protein
MTAWTMNPRDDRFPAKSRFPLVGGRPVTVQASIEGATMNRQTFKNTKMQWGDP